MLEISPTSPAQVNLGQPGNIAVPEQNIEYFQRLMSGLDKGLNKGEASLTTKEVSNSQNTAETAPPLEAQNVLNIQKAEYNIGRLHRHLLGGIQKLENGHTMDGKFVQAVTQQQFNSAYYFLAVGRVSGAAEDTSEEITSVTKGR